MYTFALEDTPVELVNYRVTATAKLMSRDVTHHVERPNSGDLPVRTLDVLFGGSNERVGAAVYARWELPPGLITNDHHDQTVIATHDNFMMEWLARGVTIRMGGVAYIAEYPMDGATAKRVSVSGTIGLGLRIGRAIREAREQHLNPFEHLIENLGETNYSPARMIFKGKINEVYRRTSEGFAKGAIRLQALDPASGQVAESLEIEFQNENLIARSGDQVLAVVPDLICILDSETAEPITTEELRYGQRVSVLAVRVPEIMRTPQALKVWGPKHFGFDVEYVPTGS